ncbi:MAG: tryptophan--tRNA ligase [Bdellovibrionales bacterium]|nr:tryptophan--tRNA ligase [Bdellovibrionales bacterium]
MARTILTGIKPTGTGDLHLGNYVGAIQPSIKLSREKDVIGYFFIANYHSLTSLFSPKEHRLCVRRAAASWLACGLDGEKVIFYLQSDIPELLELNWILSCVTPKGLMNRAHSYKAKQDQNQQSGQKELDDGVNMGLYGYPVLMAADILLFSANEVPVGGDQIQHLEMTRDIAQKFNRIYKTDLLCLPKTLGRKEIIIPGLDGRKMSKSYNNTIPLFCDPKALRKLVMKIKTDSLPPEEPKNPENSLIFEIYTHFAEQEEITSLRKQYSEGIGWGEAKEILYEKLNDFLKDKRDIYHYYMEENSPLDKILKEGKEKARAVAQSFMKKVRSVIGLS